MNVQGVADRVKRIFGDEGGVQITDTDLIRWINDAQEQIVADNQGLMEATVSASSIANQADYDVPVDLFTLRSLMYNGFRLKSMSFQEFNEYVDGFRASSGTTPYTAGTPEMFMVWNRQITLFPTPDKALANGIRIYYIKHPPPVANLADSLSVPLEYHNIVVDYCLQQAYEIDEDIIKFNFKKTEVDENLKKLNDLNKSTQEYYPRITVLPEDDNYGNYGYWGGYF